MRSRGRPSLRIQLEVFGCLAVGTVNFLSLVHKQRAMVPQERSSVNHRPAIGHGWILLLLERASTFELKGGTFKIFDRRGLL